MHFKNIFFISCLFLQSCAEDQLGDCFTSVGENTVETRQLGNFHTIDANKRFGLVIAQDSIKKGQIEISGGKNILKGFTTEITEGTLKIRDKNKCNIVRQVQNPQVKIYFWKDLKNIKITSAASCTNEGPIQLSSLQIIGNSTEKIELTNLDIDYIGFESKKSTDIILSGKTKEIRGQVNEVSNLYAWELEAENVLIDNHTVLNCFVDGSKIIYVNIYNDGHIYYRRPPMDKLELVSKAGRGDLLLYKP